MAEKLGIEELKDVVKFGIELGEAVDVAMADGKFELTELVLLMAPLMQIGPAFSGIDKIGGEIADLDAAELAELKMFVEKELDLTNDKVEEIIEKSIGIAVQIYGLVQLFSKKDEAKA